MFGMILVIAFSLLVTVPFSSYVSAINKQLIYLGASLVGIFVLVGFTSICLAIQFNCSRLPLWLWNWKEAFEKFDKKLQSFIQRNLWTALIVSLLAVPVLVPLGIRAAYVSCNDPQRGSIEPIVAVLHKCT